MSQKLLFPPILCQGSKDRGKKKGPVFRLAKSLNDAGFAEDGLTLDETYGEFLTASVKNLQEYLGCHRTGEFDSDTAKNWKEAGGPDLVTTEYVDGGDVDYIDQSGETRHWAGEEVVAA